MREGFGERLVPPGWPFTPEMQAVAARCFAGGELGDDVGRSDGFQTRACDLWIQAASGGEAYLAWELLRLLEESPGLRVLCTTCTSQGLEILHKAQEELTGSGLEITVNYLPLDEPGLMRRAVKQAFWGRDTADCTAATAEPTGVPALGVERTDDDSEILNGKKPLLVLLETEIWPGLLAACAEAGVRVLILNGRMTEGSFRAYKALGWLLRRYSPQGILATAKGDLERFCRVFDGQVPDAAQVSSAGWVEGDVVAAKAEGEIASGRSCPQSGKVEIRRGLMNNIKFDRLVMPDTAGGTRNGNMPAEAASDSASVSGRRQGRPVIALGSVRQEEEGQLLEVIMELFRQLPESCIVVAPRHMHRVEAWSGLLAKAGVNFCRRSQQRLEGAIKAEESAAPSFNSGQVLLWDVFGQMPALYERVDAIFIGGSLAPLGGQNFLEPLAYGLVPCIGPHWKNFYWAGQELCENGLVRQVQTAGELASALVDLALNPRPRIEVRQAFETYLAPRRGGTRQALALILKYLAG